ncbi:MAG: chloramphenicol acetyltransferase [Bacteroides sp.]|nr:chloramphenicol acetyltransferase [Bacteroides sp.]
MDYPQYNICMNLDVTRFLAFTREHHLSFYYSMIYAVTDVVNSIDEFRYRIREGKVVLHDKIHLSFTDMDREPENQLFKMVTLDLSNDIATFVQEAGEKSRNQQEYFDAANLSGRDDLIYITCLPWISFTHMSHTISLKRDDAVPRISWGKYYKEGDRVLLPFSVQVHHGLMDGYHVGKYLEALQVYLNEME